MGTSKALGILILVAIAMGLFFLAIRKGVFNQVSYESTLQKWVTYLILYAFFTLVAWGVILAIWFGIHLIVA